MINVLKLLGIAGSSEDTEIKLGLIYNWYAATDPSLIYADGWKIPTSAEFNTLRLAATPDYIATEFKETGTTYWASPNTWATNALKFNARGAGWRDDAGDFFDLYEKIQMLTDASSGANTTIYGMNYDSSAFSFAAFPKKSGGSIRLLKVSTSLSDGQEGTYIGNDGKVYRTICIGSQEWLADNLAETKYRDGTPIPEVTNGATWSSLTTGALCAYNNDWDNAFIAGTTTSKSKLLFTGDGLANNLILNKSFILFEEESLALFNRMTEEPSFALKTIINKTIRDLKSYGIWDKLDALAVYAMHTEQAALLDWKDYVDHTNYNGMDFTQYTGFSYDTSAAGTNVYIGSNFDPSTKGINYTLNDAYLGFWQEDRGDSSNRAVLGSRLSGNYATMFLFATNMYAAVNMADSVGNSLSTNAFGMIGADRESSTTIKRVVNGVVGSAITQNSTKLSQRPLWVRGVYGYTVYGYSMNMFRAFFIGAHLTETEHENFYNVMNAYMIAVDAL